MLAKTKSERPTPYVFALASRLVQAPMQSIVCMICGLSRRMRGGRRRFVGPALRKPTGKINVTARAPAWRGARAAMTMGRTDAKRRPFRQRLSRYQAVSAGLHIAMTRLVLLRSGAPVAHAEHAPLFAA
nr:hypothetical protein BDOA9_0203320 [Bradyrhizobium sp. DOA9]